MRILLLISFLCSLSAWASEQSNDTSVIKKAAYYIIEGMEQAILTGGIPGSAKYATFYTAFGDEIVQVSREETDFFNLNLRLDPQAPKPQPLTYAIKYWPAISIGWGMRKGAPGYFIVFSDKNGNSIESYRYNHETKRVRTFSEGRVRELDITDLEDFDTTVVREEGSDEIQEYEQNAGQWGCNIQ